MSRGDMAFASLCIIGMALIQSGIGFAAGYMVGERDAIRSPVWQECVAKIGEMK